MTTRKQTITTTHTGNEQPDGVPETPESVLPCSNELSWYVLVETTNQQTPLWKNKVISSVSDTH